LSSPLARDGREKPLPKPGARNTGKLEKGGKSKLARTEEPRVRLDLQKRNPALLL
jgi:hypothetical protein